MNDEIIYQITRRLLEKGRELEMTERYGRDYVSTEAGGVAYPGTGVAYPGTKDERVWHIRGQIIGLRVALALARQVELLP